MIGNCFSIILTKQKYNDSWQLRYFEEENKLIANQSYTTKTLKQEEKQGL